MWPYVRGRPLFLAALLAQAIAKRLPTSTAFKLGQRSGDILYHLLPAVRHPWLKRLQQQGYSRHAPQILRKKFQNEALTLVELARFSSYKAGDSEIREEAHLQTAVAQHDGAILLFIHEGNWEMAGIGVALHGYPTLALNWPARNAYLECQQQKRRQFYGITTVHPGSFGIQALVRALRAGNLIFLMLDVEPSEKGLPVRFLGQPGQFSPLPLILAIRARAPIVPMVTARAADNRFRIRVSPFFHPRGIAYWKQDLRLLTQQLSQPVLDCPGQYDWLIQPSKRP